MSINFNPDEYYVIKVDYSSEHIPMLDWGNTRSLPFLDPEKVEGVKEPLEIMFYGTAPKNPLMNDILKMRSSYVISEIFKQFLEKEGLSKMQFFPVKIVEKKREPITGYYLLHTYNGIPAIDKNNYVGDPVDEDDGQIYILERFALDAEVMNKIPLEDRTFFCFAENNSFYLAHQSIVDKIKEAGITGILFYPVSNWLPK